MTISDLLTILTFEMPTVMASEASATDVQEAMKRLDKWHRVFSREVDKRIRQNRKEAASV